MIVHRLARGLFVLALALAGGCSGTSPDTGDAAMAGDSAADASRTLADGAACLAPGQPATGGCEACCSGRCGGMGIVASCMP